MEFLKEVLWRLLDVAIYVLDSESEFGFLCLVAACVCTGIYGIAMLFKLEKIELIFCSLSCLCLCLSLAEFLPFEPLILIFRLFILTISILSCLVILQSYLNDALSR